MQRLYIRPCWRVREKQSRSSQLQKHVGKKIQLRQWKVSTIGKVYIFFSEKKYKGLRSICVPCYTLLNATALCKCYKCLQIKVLWLFWTENSINVICPTACVSFVPLSHILVILLSFQTVYCYYPLMVICDGNVAVYIPVVLEESQTVPVWDSDLNCVDYVLIVPPIHTLLWLYWVFLFSKT